LIFASVLVLSTKIKKNCHFRYCYRHRRQKTQFICGSVLQFTWLRTAACRPKDVTYYHLHALHVYEIWNWPKPIGPNNGDDRGGLGVNLFGIYSETSQISSTKKTIQDIWYSAQCVRTPIKTSIQRQSPSISSSSGLIQTRGPYDTNTDGNIERIKDLKGCSIVLNEHNTVFAW